MRGRGQLFFVTSIGGTGAKPQLRAAVRFSCLTSFPVKRNYRFSLPTFFSGKASRESRFSCLTSFSVKSNYRFSLPTFFSGKESRGSRFSCLTSFPVKRNYRFSLPTFFSGKESRGSRFSCLTSFPVKRSKKCRSPFARRNGRKGRLCRPGCHRGQRYV